MFFIKVIFRFNFLLKKKEKNVEILNKVRCLGKETIEKDFIKLTEPSQNYKLKRKQKENSSHIKDLILYCVVSLIKKI